MDGKVVIGTALDTKELEKDIKNAEKELKGFQKEEERLNKEKDKIDISKFEEEEKQYNELINTADEYKNKIKELQKEKGKLGVEENGKKMLTTQDIQARETLNNQIKEYKQEINNLTPKIDKIAPSYDKQKQKIDEINTKLKENKVNQGLINNKLQEANAKLNQAKGLGKIKKNLTNINQGLTGTIKKVARWGLAIFGVRSAYNAVRRASSTLAQYNEQYAKNLEYIHFALASVLAPALQFLVNLAFKLLSYINYIANAWFGVNLFANASAKSMNKMAGSAKQIRKELQQAGFDEMNVLSDTSGGDAGGGAGSVMPSFDLSQMQGEVPEWIKWIAENKDLVVSGLLGIAAALLGIHFGLELIQGLGLFAIIVGIAGFISDIVEFIKDPSWENFFKILGDITIVIGGIMLLMGSWWGLLVVIVGAIVKLVADNWEKIKETLDKVGGWINDNVIKPVVTFFTDLGKNIKDGVVNSYNWIKDILSTVGNWVYEHIIKPISDFFKGLWQGIKDNVRSVVQWIKDKFNSIVSFFSGIINNIVDGFRGLGRTVGNVIASTFKRVVNAVLETIERILNSPIRAINGLLDVINAVPGINLGKLPTFNLPRLKVGGIINMPGRGVPVGGGMAVGGEAGREGVIPLTDSQAMETLGESIGKYITINANITNKMDSRVISRLLRQIRQEEDFAFNS